MATKAQAKAAIDNAVTAAKADMDAILPAAANYGDGSLSFNPLRYSMTLDAQGNSANALSWFSTIQTNMTTAARPFTTLRVDRRADDVGKKQLVVSETAGKLTVIIVNF